MYPDNTYKPLTYETDEAVYFFASAIDPLNNWSAHVVELWGQTFLTLEHGYHWKKYNETAPEIAAQLLKAPSPYAAMKIDRQAGHSKRRPDWNEVKVAIMEELIRAKVAQNEDVRDCLLKTGQKKIVENSPVDSFWGCGSTGDGQNMVGKLLMKIRDEEKRHGKID